MKKIVFMFMLLLGATTLSAQTAKSVLDKAAATVSSPTGVHADFKVTNNLGTMSGNIDVKGSKFHARTTQAIVWFDGKTQWTYMKKNDEVNVVTPTAAQLQAINPYNFINLYKHGYHMTMSKSATSYTVHLTATNPSKKIQEMFITVDKNTYVPTQVKLLQSTKWTKFDITNLKQQKIADAVFSFNQKDFPTAEVIDLR
jgi:outer membrane lipoprotein-sorting protein